MWLFVRHGFAQLRQHPNAQNRFETHKNRNQSMLRRRRIVVASASSVAIGGAAASCDLLSLPMLVRATALRHRSQPPPFANALSPDEELSSSLAASPSTLAPTKKQSKLWSKYLSSGDGDGVDDGVDAATAGRDKSAGEAAKRKQDDDLLLDSVDVHLADEFAAERAPLVPEAKRSRLADSAATLPSSATGDVSEGANGDDDDEFACVDPSICDDQAAPKGGLATAPAGSQPGAEDEEDDDDLLVADSRFLKPPPRFSGSSAAARARAAPDAAAGADDGEEPVEDVLELERDLVGGTLEATPQRKQQKVVAGAGKR
jgi:hypothetical protein